MKALPCFSAAALFRPSLLAGAAAGRKRSITPARPNLGLPFKRCLGLLIVMPTSSWPYFSLGARGIGIDGGGGESWALPSDSGHQVERHAGGERVAAILKPWRSPLGQACGPFETGGCHHRVDRPPSRSRATRARAVAATVAFAAAGPTDSRICGRERSRAHRRQGRGDGGRVADPGAAFPQVLDHEHAGGEIDPVHSEGVTTRAVPELTVSWTNKEHRSVGI